MICHDLRALLAAAQEEAASAHAAAERHRKRAEETTTVMQVTANPSASRVLAECRLSDVREPCACHPSAN